MYVASCDVMTTLYLRQVKSLATFTSLSFPGQILLRRFANSTASRQATPPCLLPKTSDQSHKHMIKRVSLHLPLS
jgi:hypothetical protein